MAATLEHDRAHLVSLARYTQMKQGELVEARASRAAILRELRETQQKTGACGHWHAQAETAPRARRSRWGKEGCDRRVVVTACIQGWASCTCCG